MHTTATTHVRRLIVIMVCVARSRRAFYHRRWWSCRRVVRLLITYVSKPPSQCVCVWDRWTQRDPYGRSPHLRATFRATTTKGRCWHFALEKRMSSDVRVETDTYAHTHTYTHIHTSIHTETHICIIQLSYIYVYMYRYIYIYMDWEIHQQHTFKVKI